jgi:hypothetical protein
MRAIAQLVCVSFLVLFSTGAYAQSAAEKEAVDVIEKYWQARNDQDFKTQAALTSEKGTLDANSDGSFFRTSAKATAEELEEQLAGSQATKVFYPEATELGKDVVMVRYYVTTAVVKESGGWKLRAWHFSPLHDGGRHLTDTADFED